MSRNSDCYKECISEGPRDESVHKHYQKRGVVFNLPIAAFDLAPVRRHRKIGLAPIRIFVLVEAGALKGTLTLALLEVFAVLLTVQGTHSVLPKAFIQWVYLRASLYSLISLVFSSLSS